MLLFKTFKMTVLLCMPYIYFKKNILIVNVTNRKSSGESSFAWRVIKTGFLTCDRTALSVFIKGYWTTLEPIKLSDLELRYDTTNYIFNNFRQKQKQT